ncbi:hypothetical protein [Leptothermofonsia sp. ETS-13]|uniref:hypothetical protein n=1 Tax=Leptothermofonsia sp. ETS-13 TaxID=3035696 RepID=UPI003BA15C92
MKASKSFGLLTVATALMLAASAMPAIAQQRVCVESERDDRIVCGRRVSSDRYDRYDRYDPYDHYDRYDQGFSNRCGNLDEKFYLTAYPDVADAIRRGKIRSACEHYQKFGRYEGRFPAFNEASYLSKNPDVADAVRRRKIRSAYEHWQKFGRYENRQL